MYLKCFSQAKLKKKIEDSKEGNLKPSIEKDRQYKG